MSLNDAKSITMKAKKLCIKDKTKLKFKVTADDRKKAAGLLVEAARIYRKERMAAESIEQYKAAIEEYRQVYNYLQAAALCEEQVDLSIQLRHGLANEPALLVEAGDWYVLEGAEESAMRNYERAVKRFINNKPGTDGNDAILLPIICEKVEEFYCGSLKGKHPRRLIAMLNNIVNYYFNVVSSRRITSVDSSALIGNCILAMCRAYILAHDITEAQDERENLRDLYNDWMMFYVMYNIFTYYEPKEILEIVDNRETFRSPSVDIPLPDIQNMLFGKLVDEIRGGGYIIPYIRHVCKSLGGKSATVRTICGLIIKTELYPEWASYLVRSPENPKKESFAKTLEGIRRSTSPTTADTDEDLC